MWSPQSTLLNCLHSDLHPPQRALQWFQTCVTRKCWKLVYQEHGPKGRGRALGGHVPLAYTSLALSSKARWGPKEGPLERSAQAGFKRVSPPHIAMI